MKIPATKILYGYRNRSKLDPYLDACRVNLKGGQPNFLVLAPSRLRKLELLSKLIGTWRGGFDLPVLTLKEFVGIAFRELQPGLAILTELEKRSLISLLSRPGEKGERFSSGKVAQLSRLVATIKSQNITDPDLLRLQLIRKSGDLDPFQQSCLDFFRRYQEALQEQHREDWEGSFCQVHDGLVTGALRLDRIQPGLECLIAELSIGISPIESSIISLLSTEVERMILMAPLSAPGNSDGAPNWVFLQALRSEKIMSEEVRPVPTVIFHEDEHAELRWALDWVERHAGTNDSNLRIGIVCDKVSVVRNKLLRGLREKGLQVSARDRDPGFSLLAEGFLQYLELLRTNFRPREVFDLLAQPRFVCGIPYLQLNRLERLVQRAGIDCGVNQWVELLPPAAHALQEEIALDSGVSDLLLDRIRTWDLDTSRQRPFQAWYEDCYKRLTGYLSFESLNLGEGCLLEQFRRALSMQSQILAKQEISFAEFTQFCRESTSWRQESSPAGLSRILLGSPQELQNCEVESLLWLGLTEDAFPPRVSDPLAEVELPSPIRTSTLLENFRNAELLFQNLLANSERAILSFPQRIGDRTASPNPLLALFQATPADSPDKLLAASPGALQNIQIGRRVQALRESLQPSAYSGFLISEESRQAAREALWPKQIRVTPSQLEQYTSCPFRLFARRVLSVSISPPDASALTGAEMGELVHRILYRFRQDGFESPGKLEERAQMDWIHRQSARMREIARQEIARLQKLYRWGEGLYWDHIVARLLDGLEGEPPPGILADFVSWEWDWGRKQRGFREEFRAGPILLGDFVDAQGSTQSVHLRGRLDRIDQGQYGLTVIDYKTGDDVRGRCYQGWGFQLPLYRLLALETLGQPISDAFFFALRLPHEVRVERLRFPGSEREVLWKSLMDFYRTRAIDSCRQIHSGFFPPTLLARSQAGCRTCDFREICRFDGTQANRFRRSGKLPGRKPLLQDGLWTGLQDLAD